MSIGTVDGNSFYEIVVFHKTSGDYNGGYRGWMWSRGRWVQCGFRWRPTTDMMDRFVPVSSPPYRFGTRRRD